MNNLLKNKKILFIGGAPRSGTTLISQLIDGHPEFIVFPFEHSSIEQYYRNNKNKSFFLKDFINHKQYGQQAILANELLLSEYYNRIEKEYGKKFFQFKVNPKDFKEGYLDYLSSVDITLENILKALVAGLIKGVNIPKKRIEETKYLVFKKPFYTELLAKFVVNNLDNALFIHIYREPIHRYASAKSRRISQKGQNLNRLNYFNFTFGHTLIDISNNFLKNKNIKKLGIKYYKVVDFNKMIDENEIVFKDICNFLDIKYDKIYFKTPTRLGNEAIAGSKYVKKGGIDKKVTNRGSVYHSITNSPERICHAYFLYQAKLSTKKINTYQFIFNMLIPHKFSSLGNYASQITFLFYFKKYIDESSIESFLKDMTDGKLGVSGAT